MSKKQKKAKVPKIDGLSPADIAKIRTAIRQVWHWSYPRKLCVARCTGKDGFQKCEKCKKRAPKVFVDHIINVGDVDGGFIARLFCPSSELQGLCAECHRLKTALERKAKKDKANGGVKPRAPRKARIKKTVIKDTDDFY